MLLRSGLAVSGQVTIHLPSTDPALIDRVERASAEAGVVLVRVEG